MSRFAFVIFVACLVELSIAGSAKPKKLTKCLKAKQDVEDTLAEYKAQGIYIADLVPLACDKKGNYERIQCHMAGCYCVHPKSSKTLYGNFLIPYGERFNCKKAPTQCQKDRFELLSQNTIVGQAIPECDAKGRYERIQCGFRGDCRCVHPKTGKTLYGGIVFSKDDGFNCKKAPTKCQKETFTDPFVLIPFYEDEYIPACDHKGRYLRVQCSGIGCHCVNPKSGEDMYNIQFQYGKFDCKKMPTKCQRDSYALFHIAIAGYIIPTCDSKGRYNRQQCNDLGDCYCVNPQTGEVIFGTKTSRGQEPFDCSRQPTKCELEAYKVENPDYQIADVFMPVCEDNGLYNKVQCQSFFLGGRQCWCVDPTSGQEIYGTRVSGGDIDCQRKPTKCELEVYELENTDYQIADAFIPVCEDNGLYNKVQCQSFLLGGRQCWCVNPTSGKEIPGSRVSGGDIYC